jgi:hypothetical protein
LDFEGLAPVSVDRNDARALITTAIARTNATVGGSTVTQVTVVSSCFSFVAEKILALVVYRSFDATSDVAAARTLAQSWVDAVLAAN